MGEPWMLCLLTVAEEVPGARLGLLGRRHARNLVMRCTDAN